MDFQDDDGELKLTIMATLAQNESKKTSQRVKAGQKISFQNGVVYGTGNIMGYDKIGKELVINEEQAEVVKLIFKLFLDGYGTQRIKYELEKRGIPTATGLKTWSFATISRMLQNPFYCGTVIYRKEFVPDFLEQKRKKNRGDVEQVIVEGKHQPIISKEDFEKVQKLIQSHSTIKTGTNRKQVVGAPKDIWSKKLVCECGSRMNKRIYSKSNNNIIYGYYCYKQKNEGSARKRKELGLDTAGYCDVPMTQEWKLELMATMIFKKLLTNQSRLKQIAFDMIDKVFTEQNIDEQFNNNIVMLKSKLESIKSKKDKLLNTYIEGFITKEQYSKKNEELVSEEEKINNKIKEEDQNSLTLSFDLKDKIKMMKDKISSKLDYELYNLSSGLIESLVDKIVVHNNRFEWKLNCIADISKYDNEAGELGIYFLTLVITEDDLRNYNLKNPTLKKIFQKEPIIVDIYI